jgi:hypothetical protein
MTYLNKHKNNMENKEIILSDQGGKYTVPVKGGDAVAKEYVNAVKQLTKITRIK